MATAPTAPSLPPPTPPPAPNAEARFLANQASRLAKSASSTASATSAQSLTTTFWSNFNTHHVHIKQMLTETSKLPLAVTATQRLRVEQRLSECITHVQSNLLGPTAQAASEGYLVDHDVGRGTRMGEELLNQIQSLQTKLVPREKFRFKCRDKYNVKQSIPPPTTAATNQSPAEEKEDDVNGIYDKSNELIRIPKFPPTNPTAAPSHYCGDFRVRRCSNCVLTLDDAFGALRLQDLKNCTIYAGPVAGPLYVENCTNCTIVVASRQLRIHDTYDTQFFVNVRSGPIIEDCARTKFGRYRLSFKTKDMEEMFKVAGLNLDRGGESTFWRDVKDFKWHRATKSPNFDLIEDGSAGSKLVSKDVANVEFIGEGGGGEGGEKGGEVAVVAAPTPTSVEDRASSDDEEDSEDEL